MVFSCFSTPRRAGLRPGAPHLSAPGPSPRDGVGRRPRRGAAHTHAQSSAAGFLTGSFRRHGCEECLSPDPSRRVLPSVLAKDGGHWPLVVALGLVLSAFLLAPEQPQELAAICERHNGISACRVW
jgi:hypothetical protein